MTAQGFSSHSRRAVTIVSKRQLPDGSETFSDGLGRTYRRRSQGLGVELIPEAEVEQVADAPAESPAAEAGDKSIKAWPGY